MRNERSVQPPLVPLAFQVTHGPRRRHHHKLIFPSQRPSSTRSSARPSARPSIPATPNGASLSPAGRPSIPASPNGASPAGRPSRSKNELEAGQQHSESAAVTPASSARTSLRSPHTPCSSVGPRSPNLADHADTTSQPTCSRTSQRNLMRNLQTSANNILFSAYVQDPPGKAPVYLPRGQTEQHRRRNEIFEKSRAREALREALRKGDGDGSRGGWGGTTRTGDGGGAGPRAGGPTSLPSRRTVGVDVNKNIFE